MKHVHKLAWIGLFVNIIICFVARNLLLDEGQLNFHSRADGVWSWLVLALFIAVVVQAISIMLSGRYPYLAIVLAFVGGIVMVPASVIFLVGSLFSLQTRINAGFTPWRSTTAVGEADNQQLLTFNASGFYPQGACYEGNHLILPGRDGIKREPAGLLECLVLAFDTNSREDGWFWIKFDTGALLVLSHF